MKHPQDKLQRLQIKKKKKNEKKGDRSYLLKKLQKEQLKERETKDELREYSNH